MLDRDEDMIHSGTRHPFLAQYKVGFNGNGRINSGKSILTEIFLGKFFYFSFGTTKEGAE